MKPGVPVLPMLLMEIRQIKTEVGVGQWRNTNTHRYSHLNVADKLKISAALSERKRQIKTYGERVVRIARFVPSQSAT